MSEPDKRPAPGRRILSLAVPALGALIAEPLLLLTDTALVGHLGSETLAGLGVASTVLQTAIGLMVFLAYTTTPIVARRLGAGDTPGAIRAGIEGMWFGLGVGVVLAAAGLPAGEWLISFFTGDPAARAEAWTYLLISLAGVPAMLVVIAATGLLRGLQNTRTPLIVSIVGAAVNAGANAALIYAAGLGIAGAALGTVAVQWGMALVYAVIAVRAARANEVSLAPGLGRRGETLRASGWMILRTLTLRASLVTVVWMGGRIGVDELAALQVLFTLYNLTAFALDALAIAGQALVGRGLGAGDRDEVRAVTTRLIRWAVGFGALLGCAFLAASPVLGRVFTSDVGVLAVLPWGVATLALTLPLAGYVFVLDGILIGAGDARYLAIAGVVPLVVLVALEAAVIALGSALGWNGPTSLVALWAVFGGGFLGTRALTLWWRSRGDDWMITGATR
ncbi:MATE family efflux transporter [Pseudoclavibacter endophyticus]|uniref:MATE family efflux transporter n=1 Tax=Pseudoclavibacter endophyticus TaxID=1778590 RepID=A0A6H9WCV7_9MICO|nr:MATE family efflux transporter [Pseudoclavibacter endophyticus]KAB1648792.1 MATE family efflux transporter [Pseudoclavibacter endophyticus]GGA68482.1 MATE family efflux transporter [Pseudoclavibacter endophyticus]